MSDVTKLGELLDETAQRDAVHVAVAPVIAAHRMPPGTHVGLMSDGTAGVLAEKMIGIVDPYLLVQVDKGDRFWLFLYPQTITSLRHQWTHPAFPDLVAVENPVVFSTAERQDYGPHPPGNNQFHTTSGIGGIPLLPHELRELPQERSHIDTMIITRAKTRLAEFATEQCITLDELMEDFSSAVVNHGTVHSTHWNGTVIPPSVWDAYETVIGKSVDRVESFSCSC